MTIDFKEALDFESMLQAGLQTETDGKMLSSAGMFYFNTRENLAINKPIGIEVPAATALEGMKLFKGDTSDGSINWEEPQPIAVPPAPMQGIDGKALFNNTCASCHKIDKDLTGPALAWVAYRWGKRWEGEGNPLRLNVDTFTYKGEPVNWNDQLYEYTRNNFKYLSNSNDQYACCISKKWSAIMNLFPALTDADLNALYNYIDDESERLGLSPDAFTNSCDSCDGYQRELKSLLEERVSQAKENDQSVKVEKILPPSNTLDTTEINLPPLPPFKQEVSHISKNADYYKITIKESGWFNIDILLNERNNVAETKLMVRLQGSYEKEFQVFLAIPSFKVFAQGGYLPNSKNIGFKYEDGTLPLPQNTQALVFAMGEEKGQFYFAKRWFNTTTNQTINLDVQVMSQRKFEIEISKIQQPGLDFSTDTSKNSSSLKAIDEQLEKIKKGGLKNCSCGATDSARVVYEYIH